MIFEIDNILVVPKAYDNHYYIDTKSRTVYNSKHDWCHSASWYATIKDKDYCLECLMKAFELTLEEAIIEIEYTFNKNNKKEGY